jgi:hypothetical protein
MTATRKHLFSFFLLLILAGGQIFAFSLLANPVSADETLIDQQEGLKDIKGVFGWGEEDPDIRVIIVNIIQVVLGFLGVIFLSLMVFAGFKYMTSAGNEEQTKKALSQIKDSVIGLAIVLASWIITTALLRYLIRAVNNNVGIFD